MPVELREVSAKPPTVRSLAGHFGPGASVAPVTADNLNALRLDLSVAFRVFGEVLGAALNHKPFSKSYTVALCNGKKPITQEIARAYYRIASAQDDTDPDIGETVIVQVHARPEIAGALVTGKAIKCDRPGCPVKFVKHHPSQRFHSPYCQKKNAKESAHGRNKT